MGKLEVRGNASKTVDYDLMKIKLDFHAKEKTATEASQKVMRECEEFLGNLKKGGVDIFIDYYFIMESFCATLFHVGINL